MCVAWCDVACVSLSLQKACQVTCTVFNKFVKKEIVTIVDEEKVSNKRRRRGREGGREGGRVSDSYCRFHYFRRPFYFREFLKRLNNARILTHELVKYLYIVFYEYILSLIAKINGC